MNTLDAYNTQAPVALFIFNRPDFTRRVLDAISLAKPRAMFVVADGPRNDHPEDERLVEETRAVIDRVDWPAEVLTHYSDVNLGCTRRIASGLDWVFQQASQAIILEDDCLPGQTFFPYCEELLDRYRDSEQVHMVSGSNPVGSRGAYSYHFSRNYQIWGWATWARAWSHYEEKMDAWPKLRETSWLEDLLRDDRGVRIAKLYFDEAYAGRMPWDFYWAFSGWVRGAVSIAPSVNLVENIGYGENATHERDASHPFAGREAGAMTFPLQHPPEVQVLEEADRAAWDAIYPRFPQSSRPSRWRRLLRRGYPGRGAVHH